MTVQIIVGDCRQKLRLLADGSVHCVFTSPPYYQLRDYNAPGQIGLEANHHAFVDEMVLVFREVRRVLRDDGVLWLNIGDSYASMGGPNPTPQMGEMFAGKTRGEQVIGKSKRIPRGGGRWGGGNAPSGGGIKAKDLIGIPWRVALALQDDGWWLRQDNIWHKPNPMPESVEDRCTRAHEYVFMLTKSEHYYFDPVAIVEEAEYQPGCGWEEKPKGAFEGARADADNVKVEKAFRAIRPTRNKRSVWTIASQPFPKAHFATFPPALVEPGIRAATTARGCCVTCGEGWWRVTAPTERYSAILGQSFHDHETDLESGMMQMRGEGRQNAINEAGIHFKEIETLGWYPGCDCYGVPPLPPYPPYVKRKAHPSDESYEAAVAARRLACRAVDRERSVLCQNVTQLESRPAVVLDPFGGAGTTALVADREQRDAILIELNPDYAEMARERVAAEASPLFSRVHLMAAE